MIKTKILSAIAAISLVVFLGATTVKTGPTSPRQIQSCEVRHIPTRVVCVDQYGQETIIAYGE